jgi:nucleoside triphosphate pyrophosphatase
MRLILASASPRRADLLRAAGFTFETVVVDVDESVRSEESPERYVRRLAAEKSFAALKCCAISSQAGKSAAALDGCATSNQEVAQGFSPAFILAADTTVVIDNEILGKPRNDDEAAAMLERLSGRRHDVLTGVSIRRNVFEVGRVETTAVSFAALTPDEVAWYVGSGEGRDKAGAYAIQGLASRFVTRIEGSYSNVVGLPVAAVVELLTEAGFFQEELRKSRT